MFFKANQFCNLNFSVKYWLSVEGGASPVKTYGLKLSGPFRKKTYHSDSCAALNKEMPNMYYHHGLLFIMALSLVKLLGWKAFQKLKYNCSQRCLNGIAAWQMLLYE